MAKRTVKTVRHKRKQPLTAKERIMASEEWVSEGLDYCTRCRTQPQQGGGSDGVRVDSRAFPSPSTRANTLLSTLLR
jgi:hypothetical protein